MSKSLKRVRVALEAAGLTPEIRETGGSRTAQDAADAIGCALGQIVKSIIFRGEDSGSVLLFLTAGGNQIDVSKASALVGEPLGKADADLIRKQTGFAIGGVAPVGHLSPVRCFLDPRLLDFAEIWAAAGTPRHVFCIDSNQLARISDAQVIEFTS